MCGRIIQTIDRSIETEYLGSLDDGSLMGVKKPTRRLHVAFIRLDDDGGDGVDEAVVNLDVVLLEGQAGGGNLLARDHLDFSREASLVKLTLGDVVEDDILEAVVGHEVKLGETLRLGKVAHGVVVRRENRDRTFRGEFTGSTSLSRRRKRNALAVSPRTRLTTKSIPEESRAPPSAFQSRRSTRRSTRFSTRAHTS